MLKSGEACQILFFQVRRRNHWFKSEGRPWTGLDNISIFGSKVHLNGMLLLDLTLMANAPRLVSIILFTFGGLNNMIFVFELLS